MKILVFGSLGIDYSYWIPHFLKEGEELRASRFERLPGGRGLKQATSIAKSGEEVYFAGCIGKDGLFLKEYMEENGVDTGCLKISDAPQSHAIKQRYGDNEYSIISYGQTNNEIDESYIDNVLERFDSGDIILIQNEIGNIPYIIDKAYERGMRVFFNPSPFDEELRSIDYSKVDTLILSEKEAEELTGVLDVRSFCEYFRKYHKNLKVLLTLGAIGGIYLDGEFELSFPSYSEAQEAVGSSGDTFVGYFVSGIRKGLQIEKILKKASCASALVVLSKRNNMLPTVPSSAEVEEALKTLKPNKRDAVETERRRRTILEYIDSSFTDPSIGELAARLGYSRSYMTIWIKKNMKTSFTELIKERRCERAAELLRETDTPIEEIIRQLGCENGSFFRRVFKAKYGKSPLEYRNLHGGR